jgi:hypothetical protein
VRHRDGGSWLRLLEGWLRELCVEIDLGGEGALAVLSIQHGEAVTISDERGATILFRDGAPIVGLATDHSVNETALNAVRSASTPPFSGIAVDRLGVSEIQGPNQKSRQERGLLPFRTRSPR